MKKSITPTKSEIRAVKRKMLAVCVAASSLLASNSLFAQAQSDTIKVSAVDSVASKKEEKNRNVMLNADNNNGPRQVNIGLPFTGDIVILENDVPVVYTFYPTIPTNAWRMSNSLAKMGLLSFAEGALTFGKVGFAVQSTDREASSSFKGFATMYVNSFGSSKYEATVTGPMGKKGWGYMVNLYENFDRGNGINYMYTPWTDRTEIAKIGISKKYNKGSVRILYKYVDSKQQLTNYNPLVYEGDGKTRSIDNFELGRESYVLRDGKIPFYDPYTGTPTFADLDASKFSRSNSHNIYLTGNHKFNNGWKLTYTTMYQRMNTPASISFPLSLLVKDPDQLAGQKFYYAGTNKTYNGTVQYVISQIIPQSDIKALLSRAELTKTIKRHDVRLGLTHQYNHRKYEIGSAMYLQTAAANPQLLDMYAVIPGMGEMKVTNSSGFMPAAAGGYGSLTNDAVKKLAFYASDDIKVAKWLELGVGARIEHQNIREVKSPYINDFVKDRPLISHDFNNKWNKVGIANTVVKLTRKFGLLADLTYNSWYENYWDYQYKDNNGNPKADPATPGAKPLQSVPKMFESNVLNLGGGIYFNAGDKLNLVSKLTRITKNHIRASLSITNPANANERMTFDPMFYDISTLGWSTDIVASPFKGFSIHYLLTLQNPQYKNYQYGAFGVTYDYSNNRIPELSKTLMEIDPSYSFMKGAMRAWVSLRYFGKQYANNTNAFYYKGWWENFGGLDYRMSRNVDFKFQVTNFLNQEGVKGKLQGADQIVDATPYIGRKLVASSIRPRTIELTANFKF